MDVLFAGARREARVGRLVIVGGNFCFNEAEFSQFYIVVMLATFSVLVRWTLLAS